MKLQKGPEGTLPVGQTRQAHVQASQLCEGACDHGSAELQVVQTILDCAVEVATKSGIYATLVGES